MEDFKNYFKFPLKMWENFDIKVFTNDNKMAFDWLINLPREIKDKFVAKINGETLEMKVKKEFWNENGVVFCKMLEGEHNDTVYKLFRIRGWGMLTGIGGYNLDVETAAKIQDDFTEYCVKMLNNN
jgi:hypothetical protein